MRFDVYGRIVIVERRSGGWRTFYPGAEGKRRPAGDVLIPPTVAHADLERYLADLCHEWASGPEASVKRLDR